MPTHGWQRRDMARHIIQKADEIADGRRVAPAALRNTDPIIAALRMRLPSQGRVLEIASGTGQHAAAFAREFPALEWVPSDTDASQRQSIAAWRRESDPPNLTAPKAIDIAKPWPIPPDHVQTVLTINLLHLVSSPLVQRLFADAQCALCAGGRLIIYGPFLRGASYASDGDRTFDTSLRARDPAIGYTSVEEVADMAQAAGFTQVATDLMPANNLLLTYVTADA